VRKLEVEIPDEIVAYVEPLAAEAGISVEAFLSTGFSEFISDSGQLRHPSLHPQESRRYGISLILWAAWDPIGAGVPADEYDMYAAQFDAMLAAGAGVDAIAAELERVRTERMELGGGGPDIFTASKLVTWYHARPLD
jgi:hypothetical protein